MNLSFPPETEFRTEVRGVSIGRLRDGKICENRDYWNGAAFQVPNT